MLGTNEASRGDYGTSYADQFVNKPIQYDPENVHTNKQNLEKVSVYMNHPGTQDSKKQHYSAQMKSIFNHDAEWPEEHQPSMRKVNPRAQESNLKFAYTEKNPEDFYKTSNQKYYSNQKPNKANADSGPQRNFKDKNSKDHLVFGTHKNNYITETSSNYLDYDIMSTAAGNRGTGMPKQSKYNPLSFGSDNKYLSTYKTNFKLSTNPDSLNAFVQNYSKKDANQQSNIMMEKGPSNFMSSYNADYNECQLQKTIPKNDLVDQRTEQFQKNARTYRNIIAFEDNIMKNSNFNNVHSKFRENTPFATSYNGDYKKLQVQKRKKHFPNLQKTNFILGEFPQNYLTCNKENFQGKANMESIVYAGKANKINPENMKNILKNKGTTGISDYEVFINQGKNKLNYI